MSSPSCYLGVDVSKNTLVVAGSGRRWQFANTKDGHRKFIAQIKKLSGSGHVVCESTGSYHLSMCLALQEAGLAFTVANAARIHYFGLSEGIIAKNDPIDAGLIERFANTKQPLADPPLCREQLALSESVTHRQQLVEMIKVLRTHRQQVLHAPLVTEIDKSITALEKRLEALERKLRAQVDAHPLWKKKLALLVEVQGIGFITALSLLAKMPELGTLTREQAAALAGVAPINRESGKLRGKRMIAGGRAVVRSMLYLAGHAARRGNATLRAFADRLKAGGKAPKVIRVALARKLVILANAVLRDNTAWTLKTA